MYFFLKNLLFKITLLQDLGIINMYHCHVYNTVENIGSGALSGKMLLVRIVENNKIDNYLRAGQVK